MTKTNTATADSFSTAKESKADSRHMEQYAWKFIASFMICIIISLPVYISSVYADEPMQSSPTQVEGQITDAIAYGKDGIEGYASTAQDDFIEMKVTLIHTIEDFQLAQLGVKFNDGPKKSPSECTPTDEQDVYECIVKTSQYNDAGIVNYKIELVDTYSLVLDTYEGSVVVDGMAPVASLQPTKKAAEQKVKFKIKAEDKACTSTECKGKCAGLNQVYLYLKTAAEEVPADEEATDEDEEADSTEETAEEPTSEVTELTAFYTADPTEFIGCKYEKIFSLGYDEIGVSTGEAEFCLVATDLMGNKKEDCKTLNLDTSAPEIYDDSFALKKDGALVAYVKTGENPVVDIYINATDDSELVKENGVGDFSGLNTKKASYKEKKASKAIKHIDGVGEDAVTVYEFVWEGIELNNPDGYSCIITIKDKDENSAQSEFSFTLNVDDEGPSVAGIYTDKGYYLNDTADNIIYVDLVEAGSGLSKENVWLDLTEITGESKKTPTECAALDGGYSCSWENINPSKMKSGKMKYDESNMLMRVAAKVYVHSMTMDNAGNLLSEETENFKELYYDGTKPAILSTDVTSGTSIGSELNVPEEQAAPQKDDGTAAAGTGQDIAGQATGADSSDASDDEKQIVKLPITTSDAEIIIVTAQVQEKESGIDPAKAFIQLSNKELWPEPTPATACEMNEEPFIYDCVWEVPSVPKEGKYTFTISIADNAGNTVKSSTDSFNIYKILEKEGDFFMDEFEIDVLAQYGSDYSMNRNILFMSTQTFFRLNVDLNGDSNTHIKTLRKQSGSFVHDIAISECTASRGEAFVEGDVLPVAVVSQTYPAGYDLKTSKEEKSLLLSIPQFDPEKLKPADDETTGDFLTIACRGELIQTSTSSKKLYSPNEAIVFSANIPLSKALFTNPADSTLDAVLEYKDAIDTLDTIIDVLDAINKILKFCIVINLVMQMWNNICMVYEGLGSAFAGAEVAARPCVLGSDTLDKIWRGKTGGTPALTDTPSWNDKEELSLGFICDLTLCTSCSEAWNTKITGGAFNIDEWTPDALWQSMGLGSEMTTESIDAANRVGPEYIDPAEATSAAGLTQIRFPFDPKKNLFVALICWPPCLPTIQMNLELVKKALIAQNVCYNRAYLLGEDINDCPDLTWRIVCMLTFGQFAHILPDLLRQYAVKLVSSLVGRAFVAIGGCGNLDKATRMACVGIRIKHAIVGVLNLMDFFTNFELLKEELKNTFDWGEDSDDDQEVEDEFEAQKEEFGEIPEY